VKILIVGAGQVGTDIASSLGENHEITVVDEDAERVEEVTYNIDALAVEGDGTSMEVLREAGVDEADIVIGTTDSDETNLAVCGSAKTAGDPFTVGRVKKRKFLETWEPSPGAFGVDLMVASNVLTAEKIARLVVTPAAHDVDVFSEGTVQMAEFEVGDDSPVAGETVAEADRFDSLTFAAVLRNGDVVIPSGSTRIETGDRVVVIGSPESVHSFAVDVAPSGTPDKDADIVVFGGGEIGEVVASLLQDRGFKPRLVESEGGRARELAEELPETVVMESDATDRDFLERERIGDADIAVSALDSDEKNLLSALIAGRMGVERSIVVTENTEYTELFETVGVDVAVNPRQEVAEEITRLTQKNRTVGLALVGSEQAEVVEVEIDGESVFAGRTIHEADGDLPGGVVVGAVSRGVEFVPPRGGTTIHEGDHVVLFVEAEVHDEVLEKV
jgi:trk system potassium uptake protein TrkA